MNHLLPVNHENAALLARVWLPEAQGPAICTIREGAAYDLSNRETPTMSALLERDDVLEYVRQQDGKYLGNVADIADNSQEKTRSLDKLNFLAPCDLQALKACGVTFARSMLERVIEERAAGDPDKAKHIRGKVHAAIGDSLSNLQPGSKQAMAVKVALQEEGMWSQYLEVGIGPDAEVFSKSQPMSAVGWGASVGIHPISHWNNPEPEIVLVVNSRAEIKGITLGNDVNLRDVEGRSALLLGKAKDNNASCAIGPFIRLLDEHYTMDTVRQAELKMQVTGKDGFILDGHSSMNEISRDPLDLVAQTCGSHHQYPDGFLLFCGTLFAPTEDRDQPGQGFTHHQGDVVSISNPELGTLQNTVRLTHDCPSWTFGTGALMRNLAERGLL